MSFRVSNYDRAMAFLWALLAILHVFTNMTRYHFPLSLVASWLIAGAVAGGGFGAWGAESQLRSLERQGRVRTTLSTILFLFGGLITLFAVFFFFGNSIPGEVMASTLVFMSPMPSAVFAVDSVMFSEWERRHKRQIFTSMWRGFYVHPPLEQQQQSYKIPGSNYLLTRRDGIVNL
jgi:hypothetical protein